MLMNKLLKIWYFFFKHIYLFLDNINIFRETHSGKICFLKQILYLNSQNSVQLILFIQPTNVKPPPSHAKKKKKKQKAKRRVMKNNLLCNVHSFTSFQEKYNYSIA